MARKKLTDEDLKPILARAISHSEHLTDGKLAREREEVAKYYRGELPAPMHKGDSKYVSRDVFDAVDSMRATVLEAFSANSRIVFFRPEQGESAEEAKQATEYCRHVVFKKNNGEDIFYDVLTDGLQSRYSVVKVFYDEDKEDQEYEYENLTMDELTIKLTDFEDFDITSDSVDENGLHSGTFTVPLDRSKVAIEVIQPEDILISANAPSICAAKHVIHRTARTRSWLVKKYGEGKVKDLAFSSHNSNEWDYEKQLRFDPVGQVYRSGESYDETNDEITVYECYIHVDIDGTGTSKLWRIVFAGDEVMEKERVSRMPFASFVPLPVPHTFFGENFGKSVVPVQNARTVLIRQIINHSLMTNNPRQQVLNGTLLNPQELLDNRLGGIVNVRRVDGIAPIPQAPLNPFVFNLIQMIDEDKEEVTGISKLSQGLNKDAISSQNAQGMVEQLISASQQRTKIVARRFGLFLKELWGLIYVTAQDHVSPHEFMDVTGNYVKVNPAEWVERSPASIELALGYGEQEAEAQKWQEVDAAFFQDPELKPLYPIEKRYEVITRALEKRGIEDIRSILLHPSEVPPPKPDPMAELQMEQLKTQIEYQKAQTFAMTEKAKSDSIKAQADLLRAQTEARYKMGDLKIEERRLENDIYVDHAEIDLASKATEQKAVLNPS